MTSVRLQLLACLVALGSAAASAAGSGSPTLDEIISHNVAARGGADKLKALATLERDGRLVIPGFNIELKVKELKTRSGDYRQDVTLQGMTQIQSYDGTQAWQVQPFDGRKDPSLMSEDEAKAFKLGADIELPFVDAKAKGHTVELLGLEEIDGTPAYKLRVALKWGDESTFWIDPDSWMVIRELDRQTVRGAVQLTETDFGEYEQVAGVYVPMTEEQGPKDSDSSQKQKIVYEKASANVALPSNEFSFPAPAVQK